MISYLKGKIVFKDAESVHINTGNIGFKVFVAPKNLDKLSQDQETELFCAFVVKRDGFELYGFLSKEELGLFEVLNHINGIGPKIALKISALGTLDDFRNAVDKGDWRIFDSLKGVGTKRIQKIILEISGKIKEFSIGDKSKKLTSSDQKILATLTTLGFSRSEAVDAILEIPLEVDSVQDRVKYALKVLGKK